MAKYVCMITPWQLYAKKPNIWNILRQTHTIHGGRCMQKKFRGTLSFLWRTRLIDSHLIYISSKKQQLRNTLRNIYSFKGKNFQVNFVVGAALAHTGSTKAGQGLAGYTNFGASAHLSSGSNSNSSQSSSATDQHSSQPPVSLFIYLFPFIYPALL